MSKDYQPKSGGAKSNLREDSKEYSGGGFNKKKASLKQDEADMSDLRYDDFRVSGSPKGQMLIEKNKSDKYHQKMANDSFGNQINNNRHSEKKKSLRDSSNKNSSNKKASLKDKPDKNKEVDYDKIRGNIHKQFDNFYDNLDVKLEDEKAVKNEVKDYVKQNKEF